VGASLRDVATRAGVSVKTVSNVVNGYVHVADATRTRVQAAIDELDYRPNLSARSLRGGRSGIIALALPDLRVPYFAELARAVVRYAEERGQTVLIDQTDGERDRELVVLAGIRTHLIDGLLFSPLALTVHDMAGRQTRTPMVLLGERTGNEPADHVAIDNVAAATAATEHLISLGRTRIAAIGYPRESIEGTGWLRAEGYEKALRAAGLEVVQGLQVRTHWFTRSDGAEAMAELLESGLPFDAIFCFSDLLAVGALRVMLERGIRVPEDVAVIGLDGIEEGRYTMPSLSTIAPDKEAIACTAVDLLLERIGGYEAPSVERVIPHQLVVRESSGSA
jgi:DNA-binding LacI/PurR family transcriptional regulator